MPTAYTPPHTLTPRILDLVAGIGEEIGRLGIGSAEPPVPRLRRENRLRSIHASLAIENNSLSLEQVTAVIAGKRVLGPPKEILEVRNAFAAYEAMGGWVPWSSRDLLAAHRLMTEGLVDFPGRYRSGAVGIAKGGKLVHLAPPAERVPALMKDLLNWLRRSKEHPLVTSSVFHYELEFIHPFADGNGRIGRLWQTLILSHWKPALAYPPVEDVIRERQSDYYRVLAVSDKAGESSAFVEFMLETLLQALVAFPASDQVDDQLSDQVAKLLECLGQETLSALECMGNLGLSHRPTFRRNYLHPALKAGLIERTLPEKPNSRLQKYRRAKHMDGLDSKARR